MESVAREYLLKMYGFELFILLKIVLVVLLIGDFKNEHFDKTVWLWKG